MHRRLTWKKAEEISAVRRVMNRRREDVLSLVPRHTKARIDSKIIPRCRLLVDAGPPSTRKMCPPEAKMCILLHVATVWFLNTVFSAPHDFISRSLTL